MAADFNGDNTIDLAILHRQYWESVPPRNPVWVKLGNGNGTFQAATYPPGLMMAHTVTAADIDFDHDIDLILGVDDWDVCIGALLTLENDGGASFDTGPVGAFFFDQARAIAAADFNEDGQADYAVAMTCDTAGRIHVYMNYFDTTLYEPPKLVDNNYGTYDIIAADLDDDGDLDIATANGDISVYETLRTGGSCCRGIRGDFNYDPHDQIDISDLIDLIDCMFTDCSIMRCPGEADVDGVGSLMWPDIGDLVYLVDYIFNNGPAPPPCVIIE